MMTYSKHLSLLQPRYANVNKTRHKIHSSSFINVKHKNKTEFSKYIWMLKHCNIDYTQHVTCACMRNLL